MARPASLLARLIVPVVLARSSGAAVWTVTPPGGGGQFTTIQAAIAAAAPGDTVVVMAGSYAPFVLDKALRILGVGPSLVTVTVTATLSGGAVGVTIAGVPAGGFAMVAGMRVMVTDAGPTTCGGLFGTTPNHAVSVTNCSVPLVLSNLDLEPGHYGRGIRATSSGVLILDHVSVMGAPFGCGTPVVPCCGPGCVVEAIWTAGTHLSLNDSSLLGIPSSTACQVDGPAQALVARAGLGGADGLTWSICTFSGALLGTSGGHGLEANGASVRIAAGPGAFAAGGDGGQAPCTGVPGGPGAGGDAIRASAASVLLAPDLALLPGAGWGFPCSSPPGSAINGSVVTVAAAPLPSLGVSPALASPGGSVTLDVRGAAGSLFLVGAAGAPAFLAIAGVGGPLLLDLPTLTVPFSGTLDPSGAASIGIAVPNDPSLSTACLFLQPATQDATGLNLGPAVPFVVL